MNVDQIEDELFERAKQTYEAKEDLVGSSLMREAERNIMLHVIDDQWKDHLLSMDHLKEGHRAARVRPEGSAGRVQEGIVHSSSRT